MHKLLPIEGPLYAQLTDKYLECVQKIIFATEHTLIIDDVIHCVRFVNIKLKILTTLW